jgi:signal transduction histidine kinase
MKDGMAVRMNQPLSWWKRGALALPLMLAAAASATPYRHVDDAPGGAACHFVPSFVPGFVPDPGALPPPEALQRSALVTLPEPHPSSSHARPGLQAADVWALVAGAALLLLMHQRAAMHRMRRGHARALMAQRQQLEAEVSRCTQDLSQLARHLHTVHEDESRRLARDLHDELGALLTAAKLNAARLRHTMGPAGADTRRRLEQLEHTLNEGMALKQRIIENLVPSSLAHLGLAPALEILAREFGRRTDMPVHTDLEPLQLEDNAEITAYRLVQECLTNIARHAGASEVHIVLDTLDKGTGPCARLRVSDDGRGFEVGRARCSGHGLLGMRYRVEAAGGAWHLRSAPGHGTQVEAHLPLRAMCAAACREAA